VAEESAGETTNDDKGDGAEVLERVDEDGSNMLELCDPDCACNADTVVPVDEGMLSCFIIDAVAWLLPWCTGGRMVLLLLLDPTNSELPPLHASPASL
jgi:hypothetical protein